MKRDCFHKKDTFLFIECTAVFVLLLLPPLFSAVPFTLPPKPIGLYAHSIFCLGTISAAAYEEVLYRLYTPNRLHRIYSDYIKPLLPENSHAGALFAFFFTEFPALLLFTLGHRYLGLPSMLFAAGSGIVFRYAYLKLTRVFHPAFSITLVAAVHGLWNIGVYYYLWGHSVAA
jgi:hypothetical protein